jgi:hypothetical protein
MYLSDRRRGLFKVHVGQRCTIECEIEAVVSERKRRECRTAQIARQPIPLEQIARLLERSIADIYPSDAEALASRKPQVGAAAKAELEDIDVRRRSIAGGETKQEACHEIIWTVGDWGPRSSKRSIPNIARIGCQRFILQHAIGFTGLWRGRGNLHDYGRLPEDRHRLGKATTTFRV